MHDTYREQLEAMPRGRKGMLSARVPDSLKVMIETYAEAEGDTISNIVIEGILRVKEDRDADPTYPARILASRQAQIADLESKLAELRGEQL